LDHDQARPWQGLIKLKACWILKVETINWHLHLSRLLIITILQHSKFGPKTLLNRKKCKERIFTYNYNYKVPSKFRQECQLRLTSESCFIPHFPLAGDIFGLFRDNHGVYLHVHRRTSLRLQLVKKLALFWKRKEININSHQKDNGKLMSTSSNTKTEFNPTNWHASCNTRGKMIETKKLLVST